VNYLKIITVKQLLFARNLQLEVAITNSNDCRLVVPPTANLAAFSSSSDVVCLLALIENHHTMAAFLARRRLAPSGGVWYSTCGLWGINARVSAHCPPWVCFWVLFTIVCCFCSGDDVE
jgi:hypothetical protein